VAVWDLKHLDDEEHMPKLYDHLKGVIEKARETYATQIATTIKKFGGSEADFAFSEKDLEINLLGVRGFHPEKMEPCVQGVPCSEKVIDWFGFVTIPLLSVTAFTAIIALLVVTHFRGSE